MRYGMAYLEVVAGVLCGARQHDVLAPASAERYLAHIPPSQHGDAAAKFPDSADRSSAGRAKHSPAAGRARTSRAPISVRSIRQAPRI